MKRTLAARVDEARCIGCALCLPACPVDAIVGAKGWMHTVVEDWCVGCALCVPPCPVDCIEMQPAAGAWTPALARDAVSRHAARRERHAQRRDDLALPSPERRRALVAAALDGKPSR